MVRKIRLGACDECGTLVIVDVSDDEATPVGDACRSCGTDLDGDSIVK